MAGVEPYQKLSWFVQFGAHLRKEAARTQEFLATAFKRYGSKGSKGKELKCNDTDP